VPRKAGAEQAVNDLATATFGPGCCGYVPGKLRYFEPSLGDRERPPFIYTILERLREIAEDPKNKHRLRLVEALGSKRCVYPQRLEGWLLEMGALVWRMDRLTYIVGVPSKDPDADWRFTGLGWLKFFGDCILRVRRGERASAHARRAGHIKVHPIDKRDAQGRHLGANALINVCKPFFEAIGLATQAGEDRAEASRERWRENRERELERKRREAAERDEAVAAAKAHARSIAERAIAETRRILGRTPVDSDPPDDPYGGGPSAKS
jgi:hypothetical protein